MSTQTPSKCALITGASAGIGAEIARVLSQKGYRLALTARRQDRLDQLAHELGGEVAVFPIDLGNPDQTDRLIAAVIERFGRLDVLINNAGFGLPEMFHKSEPEALRNQIEVNFTAPILLARYALPHLITTKGTIINIGSSITAIPNGVMGVYGATKSGLGYWNDALRRELKHKGVKVCLVEPGPVATEFFNAVSSLIPEGGQGLEAPRPPGFSSASVNDVAKRIVRLIDHPKRRITPLRRFMIPWRALGVLFRVWPWLGDLLVNASLKYFEHTAEQQVAPRPSK